jgi:hypothetical protein
MKSGIGTKDFCIGVSYPQLILTPHIGLEGFQDM